jgi:hypothetical protein
LPAVAIARAENRLGVHLPAALRSFYRNAGHATDFTTVYDRFLSPDDWRLSAGKVVFMVENQEVVAYGTDARLPSDDPPVAMTSGDDGAEWSTVCSSCSEFLDVMLHWEGAFGGAMPHTALGIARPKSLSTLERNWIAVGEVNEMRAFRRAGCAACCVQWQDEWRVYLGAVSPQQLTDAAEALELQKPTLADQQREFEAASKFLDGEVADTVKGLRARSRGTSAKKPRSR